MTVHSLYRANIASPAVQKTKREQRLNNKIIITSIICWREDKQAQQHCCVLKLLKTGNIHFMTFWLRIQPSNGERRYICSCNNCYYSLYKYKYQFIYVSISVKSNWCIQFFSIFLFTVNVIYCNNSVYDFTNPNRLGLTHSYRNRNPATCGHHCMQVCTWTGRSFVSSTPKLKCQKNDWNEYRNALCRELKKKRAQI